MITVPFDPPLQSPCKIAFVAEAPGSIEVLDGKPLVGPSGKIFDSMLRMAGINRQACLISNLFNVQLPDNDVHNFCITTKEKDKIPGYDLPPIAKGKWLAPEHHHHLERLADEIKRFDPTIIVPLGGTALWAFTGFSGIKVRRGAVAEATMIAPGKKLLPTYHPAFLLHSYQLFPLVVMDLLKAEKESGFGDIRTTQREIWVEPLISDIQEFKERYLEKASYISIDIETPYLKAGIPRTYRQIKCIGFASDPHHAITIPFVDERNVNNSYWKTHEEEKRAWVIVKEICENDTPKLGQNFGAFDIHWLFDIYRIRVNNYTLDTRLMHHALYPELPKSLDVLGACYASERSWKTMRESAIKRDD